VKYRYTHLLYHLTQNQDFQQLSALVTIFFIRIRLVKAIKCLFLPTVAVCEFPNLLTPKLYVNFQNLGAQPSLYTQPVHRLHY